MPMTDEERDKKLTEIHEALYVGGRHGGKSIISRLERLEIVAAIMIFVGGAACLGVVGIIIDRVLG